jgi:hypothetical protein
MENLDKLQEKIKAYIEKKIAKYYSFELWKSTLVHIENKQYMIIFNEWHFFYGNFAIVQLNHDVIASSDLWDPCLDMEFAWKLESDVIGIRATLVKGEVRSVMFVDMLSIFTKYGSDFDFEREFEKNIVLIDALTKESN